MTKKDVFMANLVKTMTEKVNRVMPEFLKDLHEMQKGLALNSKENPIVIDSPLDKTICKVYETWKDLEPEWPVIQELNPKLFDFIQEFLFGGEDNEI